MTANEQYLHLIDYKDILLLKAYEYERSQTQAGKAIAYCIGKELHPGRDLLPRTKKLLEWRLIERTNPGECRKKGYKHLTTEQGKRLVNQYFDLIGSISEPNTKFGF